VFWSCPVFITFQHRDEITLIELADKYTRTQDGAEVAFVEMKELGSLLVNQCGLLPGTSQVA